MDRLNNDKHHKESLEREVLDILIESSLYLELPVRERFTLIKNICKDYLTGRIADPLAE